MSLARTVQMKVLSVLIEGLQSAERESTREPHRNLPGIPAPSRSNKTWNALDRFSFLRDWVTINFLGIVRRASHERFYADDVLAMIPPYLDPEVTVLGEDIVLIGTRGHADRLAVPLRNVKRLSEYSAWFDTDRRIPQHSPAIVRTLSPGYEVLAKGRVPAAHDDKKQNSAQFIIITRKPASASGKPVWEVLSDR